MREYLVKRAYLGGEYVEGTTLALFTLLGTTTSALADARSECESYNTPLDRRIVACSEVIRRDPRAALAYVNRGTTATTTAATPTGTRATSTAPSPTLTRQSSTAYGRKGDPGAIADYNAAIELDPKDAAGTRKVWRSNLIEDSVPHELTQRWRLAISATGRTIVPHAQRSKKIWLLPRQWMALPSRLSMLSAVATLSARDPASGISR